MTGLSVCMLKLFYSDKYISKNHCAKFKRFIKCGHRKCIGPNDSSQCIAETKNVRWKLRTFVSLLGDATTQYFSSSLDDDENEEKMRFCISLEWKKGRKLKIVFIFIGFRRIHQQMANYYSNFFNQI